MICCINIIQKSGLNVLNFRETSPTKYATTLLNALFTEEEVAIKCYEENSRTTKPGLDVKRVQLWKVCDVMHRPIVIYLFYIVHITDCVKRAETYFARAKEPKKKCNQRCLERASKRRKLSAPEETPDAQE